MVELIVASLQPSLLNFCVTDGESVVVTRYISSRNDEAASLVRVSGITVCDIGVIDEAPVVLFRDGV